METSDVQELLQAEAHLGLQLECRVGGVNAELATPLLSAKSGPGVRKERIGRASCPALAMEDTCRQQPLDGGDRVRRPSTSIVTRGVVGGHMWNDRARVSCPMHADSVNRFVSRGPVGAS